MMVTMTRTLKTDDFFRFGFPRPCPMFLGYFDIHSFQWCPSLSGILFLGARPPWDGVNHASGGGGENGHGVPRRDD